jgi:hypothetical protein
VEEGLSRTVYETAKSERNAHWFWVGVAAWITCCFLLFLLEHRIKLRTSGLFVYPLDDSYIHLAVARTLAESHVWGIGPEAFSSASSSGLWTLLLACLDAAFGVWLFHPLFANLLLAFCLLILVTRIVSRGTLRLPVWYQLSVALSIVVLTPLPSLILIGMEHVAQALSILLLLDSASSLISDRRDASRETVTIATVLLSAAVAGAIRYEAFFAILPVCVLLLCRRRFGLSASVAAAGAFGPVLFGVFYHHESGFALPFSVLVKAGQRTPAVTFPALWHAVIGLSGLVGATLLLALLLVGLNATQRKEWTQPAVFGGLSAAVVMEHLAFAPTGWLMRYESYAVALLLTACGSLIATTVWPAVAPTHRPLLPARIVTVVIVVLLLASVPALAKRMAAGMREPAQAAVDRYDEHIQVARFIKLNYDKDTIVLDDIGAAAYLTHAHILDMVGLGSSEPLVVKRRSTEFTSNDMRQWGAREHASVAILHTTPLPIRERIPTNWQLLQTWKQPSNVVFPGDFVTSFYATSKDGVPRLCSALNRFELTSHDTVIFNACSSTSK